MWQWSPTTRPVVCSVYSVGGSGMYRRHLAAIAAATLIMTDASAADRIRLAVQRTGTLAWELDVIRAHGIDRKLDLQIERIDLASTEAGKIALRGGSADLML